MSGPHRVTMVDVARLAGVSQPTVSVVLSGRAGVAVAEATRQRVLAAAAQLQFRPNRAAQSLRTRSSRTVGVVTNGIVSQPYAGRIVQGIQNVVQPHGFVCMVIDTTDDPVGGDDAVANLLAEGVAGIVYAAPFPQAVHTSELLRETRTVCVNCWPQPPGTAETVIVADEYAGGRAAAEAVFALGHRRVAFLGGVPGDWARAERQRGFVDAARAAGLDPDDLAQLDGTYMIGSGYDLADRVLDRPAAERPTALVCGNDRMAIGALLAVHAHRLSCPDDVSIVGFDDQPDVADQVRPALTTVALPHREMGIRAGELLRTGPQLGPEPDPAPARVVIDCPLVRRGSLGPPAAGRGPNITRSRRAPG